MELLSFIGSHATRPALLSKPNIMWFSFIQHNQRSHHSRGVTQAPAARAVRGGGARAAGAALSTILWPESS